MKIGIMTFHFAYNYGAMLQAYGLKKYLEDLGHEAEIVPYYPISFQAAYSISPIAKRISLRRRISNLANWGKRISQTNLFDEFKKKQLYIGNQMEIESIEELIVYCQKFELLVFGSDQIWNTDVSFQDATYFGKEISIPKVSYAASIGKTDRNFLTQCESDYIKEYLPTFKYLSVREPNAKDILKEVINREPQVVCDPVFLQEESKWRTLEKKISVREPYVLLYLLKDNTELIKMAEVYAKKYNYHIYAIHPMLKCYSKEIKLLTKVGPQEFLYLLDHAEAICTNSFHCVAFCIIFNKTLIHIPNSNSPERTMAILRQAGISDGVKYIIDKKEYNYKKLETFIEASKKYLKMVVENNNDNEIAE